MSEDFFQQGRKEMNALVVYDPREKIVDKDNYILAIHAVSNNTEAIGLLVSLHELPKNGPIAKFVKESNRIACVCGDNIPQIMRNLLTIQSKSLLS